MTTIEERAKNAYEDDRVIGSRHDYCNGYVQGATDQRKLDIDRAWKWIKGASKAMLGVDISCYERAYRKSMETGHDG